MRERRPRRILGSALVLVSAAFSGCSDEGDRSSFKTNRDDATALTKVAWVTPELPDVAPMDRDGNRVDDIFDQANATLERELASARDDVERSAMLARLDERVSVEAIHSQPIGTSETAAFLNAGGSIRHVFRAVSWGFTGSISRRALATAAHALGPNLLLLKADQLVEQHLDEATRGGRVRPVWPASFGGGYSGGPDINIAILDTGVDGTHTDLAGRMVGWHDYTSENASSPIDTVGHGSHVTGIAVGSGAAFGIGPGTLSWTDSGDLSGAADNDFLVSAMHLPAAFDYSGTATWLGPSTSTLTLRRRTDGIAGGFTIVSTVSAGVSPLALAFSGAANGNEHFIVALTQNGTQMNRFAVMNSVTNYPAVGDGFPALRGVASGSGWFGAKIFPSSGLATTSDIGEAMDDMVVQRVGLNLKVCNLSFGIVNGGTDPTQRSKANTMVANGIVVVASNGNGGSGAFTADPGRAANVITVGATNDINQLTTYTSSGSFNTGTTDDDKPDVLAPGGSTLRSRILSVDSSSADADSPSFTDVRPNDYANRSGTSMAAPFVAGSAALVIDALQRSGTPWSFGSAESPFLVKALLLASATETNAQRETGIGHPMVGRSASPRDSFEGFGIINPDAAIEAATVGYADFSDATDGTRFARRAWGRRLSVPAGRTVKLQLDVPPTGDFDVYLYSSAPSAKGTPVLLTAGDRTGAGVSEVALWTAPTASTIWIIVKRISGSGAFNVTSASFVCGNGVLENGEQCESGACCGPTCQFALEGTACNDAGTDADANEDDSGRPSDAGDPVADAGPAPPTPEGGIADGGPSVSASPPSARSTPENENVNEIFTVGGGCACETARTAAEAGPGPGPARASSRFELTLAGLTALVALGRRRRPVTTRDSHRGGHFPSPRSHAGGTNLLHE